MKKIYLILAIVFGTLDLLKAEVIPENKQLKLQYQGRIVSGISSDKVRIVLKVDSLFPSSSGYQMLLDSKAETENLFPKGRISLSVSGPKDSLARKDFYDTFDLKIPIKADGIKNTKNVVFNTSDSIDIQAGIYDYIIVSPQSNGYLNVGRGDFTWADNMDFEGGYTYYYNFCSANQQLDFSPPFEASLYEILLPPYGHNLGLAETLGLKIVNLGNEKISNFSVGFKIDTANPIAEVFTGTILPGDTVDYTFTAKADLSAAGILKIKAWVNLQEDINPKNDTLNTTLKHLSVRPIPFQETFSHRDSLKHWTIYDAAKQYGNWTISLQNGALSSKGFLQTFTSSKAADLYLISDPLQLDSGFNNLIYYFVGGNVDKPEIIELLYGSTSKIEDMQVLGEIKATNKASTPPYNSIWGQAVYNILLPESQVCYIAFHLKTTPQTKGFQLDEIRVNPGKYDLIPDIALLEVFLPANACGLSKESIGLRIKNEGKLTMNSFNLSYQINGEGEWISETFKDTLKANEIKDMYFTNPIDFSIEDSTYSLRFAGVCEGQDNSENDTLTASVIHFKPVADFPYLADFGDTLGLSVKEWYSEKLGLWEFDSQNGLYKAKDDSVALVSRCINIEAGVYRLNLSYIAGYIGSYGAIITEDFRVIYGKTNSPIQTWRNLWVVKEECNTDVFDNMDTLFEIDKSGTYSFAIISDRFVNLAIAKVMIEKAYSNDVRVNAISSQTLSRMTPYEQMGGTHQLTMEVENRGKNCGRSVKSKIKQNSNILFESTVKDSLRTKQTAILQAQGMIPNSILNTQMKLIAEVVSDSIDGFSEDNTLEYIFTVSDTVFAKENVLQLEHKLEGYSRNISMGNIYTLVQSDTITSITLGLGMSTNTNDSIEIGICRVQRDTAMDLIQGDTLFSKIVKRPSKGGFTTYSFDSIILDTASYYIYARQITDFKIQLMRDNTPSFYYKLNEENGKIIKQNSAGSLVLRANFGHKAKEVNIQADISVYEILKPADSGIFTTAENIEVTLVNYSEINISNVDVYCLVNGQKQQKTVNCEASAATNISFKADLSVVGTYTIQVFTTFENDLDKSNDTLLKIVKCIAKEAEKDTTGIESWTATTISIYPNPAKEVLYLESKGSKIQKIGVYSIGGIECLLIKINREEYTLNTSFLKPGLYLLRLKTDRGESIKKFIIK